MKEMFIIPISEELVRKLTRKQFYSVFNIKDGFQYIKLDEEFGKYCSFNTVCYIQAFKISFWFD